MPARAELVVAEIVDEDDEDVWAAHVCSRLRAASYELRA
jgi:hypothetical protein